MVHQQIEDAVQVDHRWEFGTAYTEERVKGAEQNWVKYANAILLCLTQFKQPQCFPQDFLTL